MTKQLVYVLVWAGPLPHDIPNVEVFDCPLTLHAFIAKEGLFHYSSHTRVIQPDASKYPAPVVAQPVESVGRFTAATHPYAEPVNWSGRAGG